MIIKPLASVKHLKESDTGLSVSQFNAIFDAVQQVHRSWVLSGGKSAVINGVPLFGQPTRDFEPVLGVIVNQGPLLEPDFSGLNGHQYWVDTARPGNDGLAINDACAMEVRTLASRVRRIQVENIAESATRGHLLRTDGKQFVLCYRTENLKGTPRWFMNTAPTRPFVWARVQSAVQFGAAGSNEWRYTCIEQEVSIAGWTDKIGGRTFIDCFNGYESNNVPDPSIRGNGVDSGGADYPAGFDLKPIRGNPVVPLYPELVPQPDIINPPNPPQPQPDKVIWVISDPNADDGTCD